MNRVVLIFTLCILLVNCSCRDNRKTADSQNKPPVHTNAQAGTAEPVKQAAIPGEEAYRKSCLTCHQADGSGVPGMYPSLNHADKVMGPPEGVIRVILFGLKGPSVINGQTYKQQMPPQKLLNDSTIAVLVNYVKKRWGDAESSVTAADVKKIRVAGNH